MKTLKILLVTPLVLCATLAPASASDEIEIVVCSGAVGRHVTAAGCAPIQAVLSRPPLWADLRDGGRGSIRAVLRSSLDRCPPLARAIESGEKVEIDLRRSAGSPVAHVNGANILLGDGSVRDGSGGGGEMTLNYAAIRFTPPPSGSFAGQAGEDGLTGAPRTEPPHRQINQITAFLDGSNPAAAGGHEKWIELVSSSGLSPPPVRVKVVGGDLPERIERVRSSGEGRIHLEGSQALVFFLGGLPAGREPIAEIRARTADGRRFVLRGVRVESLESAGGSARSRLLYRELAFD